MDEKDTQSIFKASYIYNIAKGVDWPQDYKTGTFVISVMGSGNIYQELIKKYNSKQIGSQQIEVKKLSKTLNISRCNILYVGREYSDMLPEIAQALAGKSTLIIADKAGALSKGAAVNFMFHDNRLDFELDQKNAASRKLFVGNTIKSLAKSVE